MRLHITVMGDNMRVMESKHGAVVGCNWVENPHYIVYDHMEFFGEVDGDIVMQDDQTENKQHPQKASLITKDGNTIQLYLSSWSFTRGR